MFDEIQRKREAAKEEEIQRNKREALARANKYIEEISSRQKEELSTHQTSVDEEHLVPM